MTIYKSTSRYASRTERVLACVGWAMWRAICATCLVSMAAACGSDEPVGSSQGGEAPFGVEPGTGEYGLKVYGGPRGQQRLVTIPPLELSGSDSETTAAESSGSGGSGNTSTASAGGTLGLRTQADITPPGEETIDSDERDSLGGAPPGWTLTYWAVQACIKPGRPRIPAEHIALIRRISIDQPGWGEDRIAEELAIKLGVKHSTSTIRRYMVRTREPRGGQTWKTFVKNHASQMFAVDFLTQYTAFFTVAYVLVVMEIATRRIVLINVTTSPGLAWVKQQIRQATAWAQSPRFLLHDNDGVFGQFRDRKRRGEKGRRYRCHLDLWLADIMGIEGIPIPYGAPNASPLTYPPSRHPGRGRPGTRHGSSAPGRTFPATATRPASCWRGLSD